RQLARARGVGHVRRAVRRPSGPAPPAHVRGVRRSSAAQGLPDQPAPAADRAPDLMAEPTRREIMLGEGSGTGSGQNLTVGMGPAHPAMHGIIRILAELDGEIIRKADVEIGYLHRAFEKDCEVGGWNNAIPYTDRLNYVSPLINNFAYANAVEKLLGIDVTERCKYIRTIMSEISRVCDHLTCIGASAMELGAFTVFLYMIKAREFLWELVEDVTGARLTISYGRVGGVRADLPEGFEPKVRAAFKQTRDVLDEVHRLLTGNRIFMDRMVGVGALSREDTIAYAITGPLLRAVGVGYDVRVVSPPKETAYGSIEGLMNHFMLIMEGYGIRPPQGEAYFASEGANGELGFYVVSDGGDRPYRVRCRPPCLPPMAALHRMIKDEMIADLVPTFGSVNMIGGELDR